MKKPQTKTFSKILASAIVAAGVVSISSLAFADRDGQPNTNFGGHDQRHGRKHGTSIAGHFVLEKHWWKPRVEISLGSLRNTHIAGLEIIAKGLKENSVVEVFVNDHKKATIKATMIGMITHIPVNEVVKELQVEVDEGGDVELIKVEAEDLVPSFWSEEFQESMYENADMLVPGFGGEENEGGFVGARPCKENPAALAQMTSNTIRVVERMFNRSQAFDDIQKAADELFVVARTHNIWSQEVRQESQDLLNKFEFASTEISALQSSNLGRPYAMQLGMIKESLKEMLK